MSNSLVDESKAIETVMSAFPNAPIDLDNFAFYEGLLTRKLLIPRCERCQRWRYPITSICPSCWTRGLHFEAVSGRARLHTVILRAATGTWVPTYQDEEGKPRVAVGVVELDEQAGLRITTYVFSRDGKVPNIGDSLGLEWLEHDGAPFPCFSAEAAR